LGKRPFKELVRKGILFKGLLRNLFQKGEVYSKNQGLIIGTLWHSRFIRNLKGRLDLLRRLEYRLLFEV